MTEVNLKKLSEIYGIEFSSFENYSETGYRNKNIKLISANNKIFNLVIYKQEKGILQIIKNANLVSNFLASKGFPTRQTIKTRNGHEIIKFRSRKSEVRSFFCCLYNYLPGNTITWDGWTMKHLKLLGWVMGEVHNQTSDARHQTSVKKIKEVIEKEIEEMTKYFNQRGVLNALENKLKMKVDLTFLELLFNQIQLIAKSQEPMAILHMDLVRGNILFENSKFETRNSNFVIENLELSGILDFEKVAIGNLVFDLARTLAFLFIDCKFKDDEKIFKYFYESGYIKRGKGIKVQPEILKTAILYFWFYDFYKFLKHNPYEFLEQNEHFIRTRNVLIKQKLIRW